MIRAKRVGGAVPTEEEKKQIRNKFVQSLNKMTNNAVDKNNERFEDINNTTKRAIEDKVKKDNEDFVLTQKQKREQVKQYWDSLYAILESNGWDKQENYKDFMQRFRDRTGYSLAWVLNKKTGKYEWKWLNTKVVPLKVDDFGLGGKLLKVLGLEKATNNLLNIHYNTAKLIEKPNIKSLTEIGKSAKEFVDNSINYTKDGVKGNAQAIGKNIAKEVL